MRDSSATTSLAAEAYNIVRQRILRGELVLGQVISRRKLAAELGMSFLPVSEALLRLEVEGMLESRPRAGTRVRIPTRDDVRGHFIVREALEMQAARLFAQHATAAERAELRKLAARVDGLSDKPDRTLYSVLHHRLHRRIAECSHCPVLSDAIEKTRALSSTWFGLLRRPAPGDAWQSHRDLLGALTTGSAESAAQATREHNAVALQRALEVLEPYFSMRQTGRRTFFRTERRQQLEGTVSTEPQHELRYVNA